jgi:hypothetical protein
MPGPERNHACPIWRRVANIQGGTTKVKFIFVVGMYLVLNIVLKWLVN